MAARPKVKYLFREYPKMVFAGNQCTIVNNAAMERELGWPTGGSDVAHPVFVPYKEALRAQNAMLARKVKPERTKGE